MSRYSTRAKSLTARPGIDLKAMFAALHCKVCGSWRAIFFCALSVTGGFPYIGDKTFNHFAFFGVDRVADLKSMEIETEVESPAKPYGDREN